MTMNAKWNNWKKMISNFKQIKQRRKKKIGRKKNKTKQNTLSHVVISKRNQIVHGREH